MMYRIPLVFTPQPEGGYTVTSPALPELITEGDTLEEAQEMFRMPSMRCWRFTASRTVSCLRST